MNHDRVKYFQDLAKSDRQLSEDDKLELQLLLKELQAAYDEGHPIISDPEYDVLMELAIYEGEVRSTSEDNSYGVRVQHPIDIMRGSLDKVYYLTSDEPRTNKSQMSLPEWIAKTQEVLRPHGIDLLKEEVVLTAKYDGMSCCLYVDNDGNKLWLTRGDTGTNEGVDIGHIMNSFNIHMPPNTAVQYELLIPNEALDELNERYSTEYKNTRALTAGIIRNRVVDYRAQFIVPIPLKLYQDARLVLHPDQFTKWPSMKCTLADVDTIRMFADKNRYVHGKFRTDGVVITLTNPKVQRILGRKFNINQYEVAYKFTAETCYATVHDVIFQVSELGVITPVLIIHPVVMKGNTINRISLHNKQRFDEMNLAIGDIVNVQYDIIPYCNLDDHCIQMNQLNHDRNALVFRFPTKCPECGSSLDPTAVISTCTNMACPSVKVGRMINYLVNLNCKGIGPETVRRLYQMGVITDIPTLYHIGSTKQMQIIRNSHGFGELKIKMILTEIKKIQKLKDYEFFGALGFRGLNKESFKKVFCGYHVNTFLKDMSDKNWKGMREKLSPIYNFGDKRADQLVACVRRDRKLIERCLKYINIIPTYGVSLSERGVVFTGFRDAGLAARISKLGYTVQDHINSNTVGLITLDNPKPSGKLNVAKQRGITIMPISAVNEILDAVDQGKLEITLF